MLDEKLRFTPTTGENSHTFVIVANNSAEFRAAMKKAAENQLLENKQIALVTCGHAFADTESLVEQLLTFGALMVWRPSRQLSPEAAHALRVHVEAVAGLTDSADSILDGHTTVDINELMNAAITHWHRMSPDDPSLPLFFDAAASVRANDDPRPGATTAAA